MANIRYERTRRTAIVTIDRPARRNAIDKNTAVELADAFRRFEADGDADVGILTGAGDSFCSGADLKSFAAGERDRVILEGDGPLGPTRMRLSKPVIAAIEGHAVAGGLELALWCDLRVMAEDAVLGVFCRRFGVPLVDLGTVRLPRLIGHGRAMDLILTGRPVLAEEALAIGLANRVVPKGAALSGALALADQIASFPQACLRSDRLSALEQWDLGEEDAARNETRRGLAVLASGESLSGAARFAEGEGRHGAPPAAPV
ncbi:MAG TPA: crotonase/enoyl-CoA hydratase family protein [Alphaproteobacteria bacterium]|jgi:enoyl-CoA hydratase|nr:crotonase/enoyl-CoA hydratase family protein [Alphaproteobacteria bacterium]